MVGGKAAAEAGALTPGAVRCGAWLGVAADVEKSLGSWMDETGYSLLRLLRRLWDDELLRVAPMEQDRDYPRLSLVTRVARDGVQDHR